MAGLGAGGYECGVGWKLATLAAVLWAVALGVWGTVAAGLVGGPWGPVCGSVLIVLAGVVTTYVPSFRDEARRQRAEQEHRARDEAAAREKWEAVDEPVAVGAPSGPAGLLRADRAVVEFTGREVELAGLRAWCASGDGGPVRVLVGGGGVGKTRVALQVAAEWAAGGGAWRLVAAGEEAGVVAAARGVTAGPVLLVVDYAETRAGLEGLLRAVLADRGVRVLLVARSLGEWWDRLVEKSSAAVAQMLTGAPPVRLDAPVAAGVPDADLVAAAMPFFADALRVAVPARVEFELQGRRVPVLVSHAAALVAVLQSRSDPVASLRVVVDEGVLGELLIHEARYWRRAAEAAGLADDGALVKAVVAAAALLGAGSVAEAAQVAARVPDLAGISAGDRRRWARWLYGLYPAEVDGRLGSVQPDLLAEAHVAGQLAADRDLARSCLRELPEDQAEHALTVLARACAHQDQAADLIATALHDDMEHLAMAAAQVAVQVSGNLGMLLAAALQDAPASPGALAGIADGLPYPSVVLAHAHLTATLRVHADLPPDVAPETRAKWSNRAGILLSQAGRPADALPPAQEAVAIRRELAAAMPDRYRPDLAASLGFLGGVFSELGRPADVLPPAEESVAIYRELAAAMPDRYRPDLAFSLDNLGIWFSGLGRLTDALEVTQQAVAIRRELAAAMPDRYRPDLASSLDNLGVRFSGLGRPADALPPAQEAVAIYRELATAMPDRYRPNLAASLGNLSSWFSGLRRPADALEVTQQAVAIYCELAAATPDRYRPDLATSLGDLGIRFSGLGRPADALEVTQQAVAIRRELAAAMPDRYRPDLAQSLRNLGAFLAGLGRPADALPPAQESVAIYRELAAAIPDRYRPDLATSLNNLGAFLSGLGRPADALEVTQQAVAIYRELAAAMPARYRPDLASSLDNLGIWFSGLGRPADALEVTQQAVAIRRELAAAMPDRYRPDLAASLDNLGTWFSRAGPPRRRAPARPGIRSHLPCAGRRDPRPLPPRPRRLPDQPRQHSGGAWAA